MGWKGKKPKPSCRDLDNEMFIKIKAKFQCSSVSCKNTWTSVHGWVREVVSCHHCGIKAKLIDVVDEQLELDFYNCSEENCGHIWQAIHDNRRVGQECEECGEFTLRQGTQLRFGRHYWFSCPNENCTNPAGRDWEDFYFEKVHTQRCGICYSRGDIIAKQEIKPMPFWLLKKKKKDKGDGDNGESTHISELCDMCCDVISKGLSRNCRKYRKAKYERAVGAGGQTTLRIISAA